MKALEWQDAHGDEGRISVNGDAVLVEVRNYSCKAQHRLSRDTFREIVEWGTAALAELDRPRTFREKMPSGRFRVRGDIYDATSPGIGDSISLRRGGRVVIACGLDTEWTPVREGEQ